MRIAEKILYHLAMRWPSPIKSQIEKLGDTDNIEHEYRYAILQQYDSKVIKGLPYGIRDKEILEIGCGHGGICLFMAMNGAKKVVGIDLNTFHLEIAKTIKKRVENDMGIKNLPIEYMEMNAYEMTFEENSFDIVYADFAFEHFMEPEKVMQESYRLLRKGGKLVVPGFLSIWSKHALHLKHGLKMPWANLFFSEQTICNVMVRLAEEQPYLKNLYPGVLNHPKKVRDLRKYKDLNDITYGKFKAMAIKTGFEIESFAIYGEPRLLNSFLRRIPLINKTILTDIFSTAAGSVLIKK
ncbi:MAG: class I SAM-dependent methyltransferase [Bacteroidia bacterium]